MKPRVAALIIGPIALFIQATAVGQIPILKQATEQSQPEPMSQLELNDLGDPFFALLLKERSQEVRLDEIENAITGQSGRRHLFVVDEDLQEPRTGQSRRSVIMYSGSNGGLRLDPNVALSVSFNDQRVNETSIEAWGWDDRRSRYNYYKLDGQPPVWKFRGASIDADSLAPADRAGTCMACHINGGPVMKELPIPWNNWHSFRNSVGYLSSVNPSRWAITTTPRFRDLRGAEDLEVTFILPSIRQFNGRRLNMGLRNPAPGPDGAPVQEVTDARRLLRPLFRTTEYNITSAEQVSGLHPLPKPGTGPPTAINVRDMFFLNADLLAGGGLTQYEGLGIAEAREFAGVLSVNPAEYRAIVSSSKTRLGPVAGDANFAWFVPQSSHIDNHMIDLLMRRGVVTREFAAAALAVDVENPVFSKAREGLLQLIPDQFQFKALNPGDVPAAHPDAMTQQVIARLIALNPAPGSPEHEFMTLLQTPSPVGGLRTKVVAYLQRTRSRLKNPQQRPAEIARLYGITLARRGEATAAIPSLVESPRLFPVGSLPK